MTLCKAAFQERVKRGRDKYWVKKQSMIKRSELFMREGLGVEMNILPIKAVPPTPPPKKEGVGSRRER